MLGQHRSGESNQEAVWTYRGGQSYGRNLILGSGRKNESSEDSEDHSLHEQIEIAQEEILGECSICWCSFDQSDYSREFTLLCGHSFCFNCLYTLCSMSANDLTLILELQCPWSDCPHVLADGEIAAILNDEGFDRYLSNRENAVIIQNPNFKYCSEPSCSSLLERDSEDSSEIVCHQCQVTYCFHCMKEWHGDISCEANKEIIPVDEFSEDLNNWKSQNNVKSCPRCKMMIHLVSGCNHMKCTLCKHEFCWLCMRAYTNEHYLEGSCAGKQFYIDDRVQGRKFVEPLDPYYGKKITQSVVSRTRPTGSVLSPTRQPRRKRVLTLPKFFPNLKGKRKTGTPSIVNQLTLCLLGELDVGKSNLILRYMYNGFYEEYNPTIEEMHHIKRYVNSIPCDVQIIDSSGNEDFFAMRPQYLRQANGFMLTFACDIVSSYEEVKKLIPQIKEAKGDSAPIVLVGNRYDNSEDFMYDIAEIREIAEAEGIPLFFTSARYGVNVTGAFETLIALTHDKLSGVGV